ncbi:hypothetical protein Aeh1ORF139c [Aeromonas phage Aeh1]|uniref:Uncharacterized protein n=1 Tax=Aeromonas phage Aeh1 TaxID=2880362 RepID=Q76YU2_9CAUD|nr:hypothetical protein Aeh1p149 [Aeromonas phage Aeh1]AAQ17804.1 hypothetical protein Aeh1ORF139c [Aeromonas phage Aeh1]
MKILDFFKRKQKLKKYDVTVWVKRRDFLSCIVQIGEIKFTLSSDVEPHAETIRNRQSVIDCIQSDLKRRNKDSDQYWIDEYHEEVNDQDN